MNQPHAVVALPISHRHSIGVQALWITAFAALTAVGAQIEIPHQPVPYTLQSFFVLLSGALLGMRNGAFSQLLYLSAGAIGLPVFAHFGFGIGRLLGPTGGYLFAFPIAAFVVGYLFPLRRTFLWALLSMLVGLFVIFTLGTLQLNFVYFQDMWVAIQNGFLIFSWWDAVKLFGAAAIAHKIARRNSQ